MLGRVALVGACILLLVAASPVRADPTNLVAPPSDLQGAYDPAVGELLLTWNPPDSNAHTYHVYRDDAEIAQTPATSFTDASPVDPITGVNHVYTVRASTTDSSMQSAPSNPFLLEQGMQNNFLTILGNAIDPPFLRNDLRYEADPCEPIITNGSPDPPYVAQVDWNCLDGLLHS